MIARIWRGLTRDSQAEEYFEYLKATGIKEYRETQGNQGVFLLRNITAGQAEFLLITHWESWDAIRRFAGDEVNKAVYYPEDQKFLLALEPEVAHYEVLRSGE